MLLPRSELLKTNELDQGDWNFRPVLGYIQRQRFHLGASLLGSGRYQRLLDLGYGSGIFLPELSRHCDELHGVDPHPMSGDVREVLARNGIRAELASAGASSMPYADEFFDAIVTVSAIECVPDLDAACTEIRRVLKPDGVFVVVTPGFSAIADFGVRVLTGRDPDADYGNQRPRVVPTLLQRFRVLTRRRWPAVGLPRLYTALRLGK
jgi:SAM-dependent methyltransferase